MSISGSASLAKHAGLISDQLIQHRERLLEPNQKKELRPFAFKEACHYIGVNENSLRHTLRTNAHLPQGNLLRGTRRYFQAEEIHKIRDFLIANGRLESKNITRKQQDERTVSVACVNLKGGSSKTSTCINLAHALSLRGYRVLVVDLDAQASTTQFCGIIPEREPDMLTLYDAIRYPDASDPEGTQRIDIREIARQTHIPNLHVVPANMHIMEFEHETAVHDQRSDPFFLRIEEALDPIRESFDVILYDCPPQMSFAVIAALHSCTSLLIPVSASFIDVMSLGTFLGMAGEMMSVLEKRQGERPYDWIKYLITRYNPTDQPQIQVSSYLRSILEDAVMASEFYLSAAVADAANSAETIIEVDPSTFNRQTYQRAWESITRVVTEFEGFIHQSWGRVQDGA